MPKLYQTKTIHSENYLKSAKKPINNSITVIINLISNLHETFFICIINIYYFKCPFKRMITFKRLNRNIYLQKLEKYEFKFISQSVKK